MASEQTASSRPENLYISYRKKGYHIGIVNCVIKGTTRKIVSSNRCQRPTAVSPTTTFGQV